MAELEFNSRRDEARGQGTQNNKNKIGEGGWKNDSMGEVGSGGFNQCIMNEIILLKAK